MMTEAERAAKVRELLREGKVQEADDLLSQQLTQQDAVASAAAAEKELPPPRDPHLLMMLIFDVISARLGHPGTLQALIAELHRHDPEPPEEDR